MRFSSLLLVTVMCGCTATRGPQPPADLLVPCEQGQTKPKTNGQLASYALELRGALKRCAAQVDALREWAAE